MVHLRDKAHEMCKKLSSEGFNGMSFNTARVEDDKLEDYWDELSKTGELTPEQYAIRRRDYAIFIADPDFYGAMGWGGWRQDNAYVSTEVNDVQFFVDLLAWVKEQVGDGVTILHHKGCHEIEVYRE